MTDFTTLFFGTFSGKEQNCIKWIFGALRAHLERIGLYRVARDRATMDKYGVQKIFISLKK